MTLEHYDLTPPISEFPLSQGVNNTIVGIRTGNGDFALKHFNAPHGLEGLQYEHDLLTWLAKQPLSFAVPAPIKTRSGQTVYQDANGHHVLMPLLKGKRPDHQDPIQIQAVGAALGELHTALSTYPTTPRPNGVSFNDLNNIHPRMPHPEALTPQDLGWQQTASAKDLCAWWRQEVASLNTYLRDTYPKLPRQVIHSDFAPSNTLYHQNQISAVLDFEFTSPDIRLIDVASGLKFSMRIGENDAPWEIGGHFIKGYQKKITPTDLERTSLIDTMILLNVVSVIWWLGRNLADNKTPDTDRMEDLRHFKTWLTTNRTRLEDLWAA